MRFTAACCALLLLAPSPQARAQETSGGEVAGYQSAADLLRKCRGVSSYGRSYCFAYLAAVADAARAYRIWIGSGEPCLPDSLSQGELVDLFVEFTETNPTLVEAQAASVIVFALQAEFPCPDENALAEASASPLNH